MNDLGMNEENRELVEGLRALASQGPGQAPPQVEERLKWEFRRVNRRRNLTTWVPATSAAAAAGMALLLWMHGHQTKPALAPAVVAAHAAAPAEEGTDAGFYPLPEAETLPVVENAMVVRVKLPLSSLRLMGVPVGEDSADASVQADLLLGEDGLARVVRLIE